MEDVGCDTVVHSRKPSRVNSAATATSSHEQWSMQVYQMREGWTSSTQTIAARSDSTLGGRGGWRNKDSHTGSRRGMEAAEATVAAATTREEGEAIEATHTRGQNS